MGNSFIDSEIDNDALLSSLNYIISNNLSDPNFNVEQLRLQVNISKSRLYTLINKNFHLSPGRYLLSRRLDFALELLRDYRLTVSQIAFKSGFNDPSFFSSEFKVRFGKTPSTVMHEVINRRIISKYPAI